MSTKGYLRRGQSPERTEAEKVEELTEKVAKCRTSDDSVVIRDDSFQKSPRSSVRYDLLRKNSHSLFTQLSLKREPTVPEAEESQAGQPREIKLTYETGWKNPHVHCRTDPDLPDGQGWTDVPGRAMVRSCLKNVNSQTGPWWYEITIPNSDRLKQRNSIFK